MRLERDQRRQAQEAGRAAHQALLNDEDLTRNVDRADPHHHEGHPRVCRHRVAEACQLDGWPIGVLGPRNPLEELAINDIRRSACVQEC